MTGAVQERKPPSDALAGPERARGKQAVTRVLRPRSVAIIGMSTRPGTTGQKVLDGLKLNKFAGDIHLVGRSAEPIDGRPVLASIEELPEGIDLAVFTLPAAGVRDAVAACVRRKVGAALVFAAGFAETGDRTVQEEVSALAREGGLAIVGPNCIGFTNNVDGLAVHLISARQAGRHGPESRPGVAYVGQSGGMLGHMQRAAEGRGLPISYNISTGNEAGLDLADFTDFLVDDAATRVIVLYAEQIRRPAEFLAACQRARAIGKPVVLMHPGRGSRAKAAAQSHTGALVGDYGVMRVQVEQAGVLLVDMLDELADVIELLAHFPKPPTAGPAVLTASGAFVALANDFFDTLGFEFPAITDQTLAKLKEVLPPFGNYGNPLDVTAGIVQDALISATKAMIEDPNVGSLLISYPIDSKSFGARTIERFNKGLEGSDKPAMMVALGDTWPLTQEVLDAAKQSPAIFSRSSDRCLRALALYTAYGRSLNRRRSSVAPAPVEGLPALTKGGQPEWLGKKMLAAAGIRVPDGALARTVDEAVTLAAKVGYPVAMKAQAAALLHKTEAGGVLLNLADEAALRHAWDTMMANVTRAQPGLVLDGALIEKMSARGLELMVGAKRDPGWGPVLLLGGIWVEALGDVRLVPADSPQESIVEELLRLRSAKLLRGFRGAPAVDLDAVAQAAAAIGRLMISVPEISEIDVNPLVAHPRGQGVTALDALIVTS
jgi:acetate---CoA ligase (ADP-forming)